MVVSQNPYLYSNSRHHQQRRRFDCFHYHVRRHRTASYPPLALLPDDSSASSPGIIDADLHFFFTVQQLLIPGHRQAQVQAWGLNFNFRFKLNFRLGPLQQHGQHNIATLWRMLWRYSATYGLWPPGWSFSYTSQGTACKSLLPFGATTVFQRNTGRTQWKNDCSWWRSGKQ
jgi:hypothetical protein